MLERGKFVTIIKLVKVPIDIYTLHSFANILADSNKCGTLSHDLLGLNDNLALHMMQENVKHREKWALPSALGMPHPLN